MKRRGIFGKYDLRSPEQGDVFFYQVVFFLALVYIVLLIANYDINWVHPEITYRSIPNALKNGTGLILGDALKAFDYRDFDGLPRARFISYALQIVNAKFRVWLFQYLVPHPSLSLTWIFSLILSPWLLFRLLRNLSGSRLSAWAGLSCYCLSIGFLSGITQLFHAGKPMSNFFAILCAYLALQVGRHAKKGEYYSKKALQASLLGPALGLRGPAGPTSDDQLAKSVVAIASRIRAYGLERDSFRRRALLAYLGLLGALFVSFFLDESAYFIFISIPLLLPAIFSGKRNRLLLVAGYAATFIAFLVLVSLIVPRITVKLGIGEFKFWECVWKPTYAQSSNIWEKFKIKNVFSNGRNLLSSQFIPGQVRGEQKGDLKNRMYGCVRGLAILYYALVFLKMSGREKKLMLRSVAVLLLFIVFQTAVQAKHLPIIGTAYYYGSLFSFYFVLPFALLFTVREQPFATLNKLLLIFLLIVSATNFQKVNRMVILDHEKVQKFGYPRFFPEEAKEMTQGARLSFALVRQAWEKRGDQKALKAMRPNYPLRALWLFRELEYIKRLRPNLLSSGAVRLSVSSRSLPGGEAENVMDDNPDTFWHVAMDQVGKTAWIVVDLGPEKGKAVHRLAALPRPGLPAQFFRQAELLGSHDGENYKKILSITQEDVPEAGKSISWDFENRQSFRYYKLLIEDGHAGGDSHHFYSLAELGLFE